MKDRGGGGGGGENRRALPKFRDPCGQFFIFEPPSVFAICAMKSCHYWDESRKAKRIECQRRYDARRRAGRPRRPRGGPPSKQVLLVRGAEQRARKKGLPFDLTADKIRWPSRCPILGVLLDYAAKGRMRPNSPSIDRIDPRRGYTLDNVQVISWRANRIKADATVEELRAVADYMEVMHS